MTRLARRCSEKGGAVVFDGPVTILLERAARRCQIFSIGLPSVPPPPTRRLPAVAIRSGWASTPRSRSSRKSAPLPRRFRQPIITHRLCPIWKILHQGVRYEERRAGCQRRSEEGASAQDDPRIAKSRLPR